MAGKWRVNGGKVEGKKEERISYLLHHLFKLFFLVLSQLLVILHGRDVETILGLGLGRLKGTRKNRNLCILQHLQDIEKV